MKRQPSVIWMTFFFLFLGGCSLTAPSPASTQIPTPQETFEKTNISASGVVEPLRWTNLAFPAGGSSLDLLVAVGEEVQQGDLLARVDDTSQQAALAAAESSLLAAEINLEKLEDLDADERDLEAARAAVEATRTGLEQVQAVLDATTLVAPYDGTVAEVYYRDHEIVSPSQPVILFADLSILQVRTTDLTEVDVMKIRGDDRVTIFFDALPDVEILGMVAEISLVPQLGAGVYYPVVITLEEIPAGLRWGMSAFANIYIQQEP